jgi:hypothetical protein
MDFDSNFLEKEIVPIDSQKYDFECYIGGEVYYIQLYVIKFVSVFSEVSVFSVYFSFLRLTSMIRKSEIFLKVALNAP